MKRKPKPEKPVPVDPKAEVFGVGDRVVVQRRPLWTGMKGRVQNVVGGMCLVALNASSGTGIFFAEIPARELKKI